MIFGIAVYSSVPAYLGGMRPYVTSLIVRPSFSDSLSAMGLHVTENAELMDVTIPYEDTDIYVIEKQNGYYAISKEAFIGVYIASHMLILPPTMRNLPDTYLDSP